MPSSNPLRTRLLIVVACVAGATALRVLMATFVEGYPFLTFYPAIMVAALLGGALAGTITLAACSVLAVWLGVVLGAPVAPVPLVGFVAFGMFTVWICGRMQTAQRNEAEIAVDQARLAAIVAGSDDAIISKTLDGIITTWNAGAERLFGYAADEIIGKAILELIPPERQHEEPQILAKLRAGERIDHYETVRRTKDGRLIEVSVTTSPVRDAKGRVVGASKIARDISAQKTFERELNRANAEARHARDEAEQANRSSRSASERLAIAIASARLGDWSWDAATDIVTLSPRAAEILDLTPGAPVTRAELRKNVHPEDRDRVRQVVDDALERHVDYDVMYRVRQGHGERWVAAMGRGQFAADGAIVGMIGVLQDVTQRRQAEAEREQLLESERAARAEAERASQLKDDFLATVSHELRTPLNAILGYAQILRRSKTLPDETLHGLEVIERNARVQAQIIEDILDMSRIVSGKLRLDMQALDAAAIVDAAIATVRPTAEAKSIRITQALAAEGAIVRADASRLQQIMWNLLSNAIKFTQKGGNVHVVVARVGSHIEISVTDDGIGISAEFLPFVFEKFRQADASAARRHGGLGLGLAIARNLVEMHGGDVRVASGGEGRGATFTVSLPLGAVRPAPTQPSGPSGIAIRDRPSLTDLAVLVVDDEADARDLVRRLLEECGARVTTASSASDALQALDYERIDVLVSDIGMPDLDGYAFIQRVRARGGARSGNIPAAALTAFARSEDRTRALIAGFQTHIAKPVEPIELVYAVASLAGRTGR